MMYSKILNYKTIKKRFRIQALTQNPNQILNKKITLENKSNKIDYLLFYNILLFVNKLLKKYAGSTLRKIFLRFVHFMF